jgi:hypothetical protein
MAAVTGWERKDGTRSTQILWCLFLELGVRSRTGLAHRLRDTIVDDAAAR